MSSLTCKHPTCAGETCRRAVVKRVRKPIHAKNYKKKENNPELDAFFADCCRIIASNPYCSNCNAYIHPYLYKFAVAHLLPKSIFESVSTHPLNWMKLGSSCGCHEATHTLDKFSKMPIFPFAVERFRQFEHLVTEKHKILDIFRDYANKLNY